MDLFNPFRDILKAFPSTHSAILSILPIQKIAKTLLLIHYLIIIEIHTIIRLLILYPKFNYIFYETFF